MNQSVLNIVAEAATDQIRVETFQGREYTVVPVIALVEGVLHSANASGPELALANEFGRFPSAWDGRPLVMNHPKVNEAFVSANSPEVLEDWSFGQLFNTELDGTKLKTEAWIDNAKVAALGGEVAETLERIQSGGEVEISTGLFSAVENTHGRFNGEKYEGIWRSISPDHLAFLSEGTIGACSVEDGCGAPRINLRQYVKSNDNSASCDCGGDEACECPHPQIQSQPRKEVFMTNVLSWLFPNSKIERMSNTERLAARFQEMVANSIPDGFPISNAKQLLSTALAEAGEDIWAIHTFTADFVVYENWESSKLYKRSFDITESGDSVSVNLGDEITEVAILPRIVTVSESGELQLESDTVNNAAEPAGEASIEAGSIQPLARSSDGSLSVQSNPEESQEMVDTPESPAAAPIVAATEVIAATTAVVEPTVPIAAETIVVPEATPAPVPTVAEYIALAPEGLRDMLSDSMRVHDERKEAIIAVLKANERCDYADEELRAMSVRDLERLGKLANVPTYVGRAPATPITNAEDNVIPVAPEAFPVNSGQAS